jgi:hypothetical protein
MSRLVDTTICPDCRRPLDPQATCTGCGLQVKGPVAVRLWHTMVAADSLVEQLRTAPAAPPTPAQSAPTAGDLGSVPNYPAPAGRPPAKPSRLPASSVPVVLLSLGALCLLVASIVFVAVTWNLLGLTGRTLVLLGLTAVLAAVAVVLTRKSLRGAAETFWLVVAGMLSVDLLAAQSAGLVGLDALSWRGTGALVGVALLAMGTCVGAWGRHQPVSRLYGAEVVAGMGATVLCSTNAWFAENPAVATTIAVPLLAGSFALLRTQVPVAAYALGGLGAVSWAVLLVHGWDRALETTGIGTWWSDAQGWPLLAAAVLAAAVVVLPGVPERARSLAAGLALFPLVLLARAPLTVGTPTRDRLVDCAVLVVLAVLTAFAPRIWARGAAVLTALGAMALGLELVIAPWDVLTYLETDGRSDPTLAMSAMEDNAASWSFVVAALAVLVGAASLLRLVPASRRSAARQILGTVAAAVLALGALGAVLELQPPLWAGVLAAALATAVAGAAAWWSRDDLLAGALGSGATAYLTLVMLYAASASHLLTALAATALFLGLVAPAALRERAGAQVSAGLTAGLAALAGALALTGWSEVFETDAAARALALAFYAGLVGVIAAPLTRRTSTRVTLECTAAMLSFLAIGVASGTSGDESTVAMVLTVVGTAICVIAVTAPDRALLGWAGAAVLGAATLIRIASDVSVPELYTLPAAALLVAVGVWRLRTDPESSSFTVLGSGITLALLPSLLLALDEPVSLRGALVGAGCVLVLGAGVQQRLAAPFVLGAITTGILALRHLQPVAEAVPRWISLGGVGLLLLVVGVTWEARRRDLENAQDYLTALR